jgi:hypothetical protein
MSNRIPLEQAITLAEASRILPAHPHPSTLFRWAVEGHRGVKLQTLRMGRRLLTSRDALQAFMEARAEPVPDIQQ